MSSPQRRRRKPSAVAKVRRFWMPILLLAVLTLAAVVVAATWPGFVAKTVVVTGNDRVGRGEILAQARVTPHLSIWLQNTGAMARRIEAIPYVDVASVGRIPPSTIRIVISERKPFAILRSGDAEALVDRNLRVLQPAAETATYPLFVLEPGVPLEPGRFVRISSAQRLRDAYEEIVAGKITPVSLQYDKFGGLVVTIHGGLRLLLGNPGDLAQKVALADAILAQVVTRRRAVAAIDLRAPSAPVLVYR